MNENTWQELLVQKHPQLFIRSFRGLPFSPAYPLCPGGWREIVTNVADRVSEAARGYSVYFCQISERYGRLRIYWNAESALPRRVERAIEEAVALAEARSTAAARLAGRRAASSPVATSLHSSADSARQSQRFSIFKNRKQGMSLWRPATQHLSSRTLVLNDCLPLR